MAGVYLIGGGWPPDRLRDLYAAFAADVAVRDGDLVYLLQRGVNPRGWRRHFQQLGLSRVRQVTIGAATAVRPEDIGRASGVFVCGGDNPLYQEALHPHASALRRHLAAHGIPYAGFSAGATVASAQAIVGGAVRAGADGRQVPVAPAERDEGVPTLRIVPGLGLVPFGVDVHATQWGTLTRLIHAVAAGDLDEGWGLDAYAAVHLADDGRTYVYGPANVYRVRPAEDGGRTAADPGGTTERGVRVEILPPGMGPPVRHSELTRGLCRDGS